jgi:hypothetical protein
MTPAWPQDARDLFLLLFLAGLAVGSGLWLFRKHP